MVISSEEMERALKELGWIGCWERKSKAAIGKHQKKKTTLQQLMKADEEYQRRIIKENVNLLMRRIGPSPRKKVAAT